MLAEFFQLLQKTLKEQGPPIIQGPGEPPGLYWLRQPDGSYHIRDAERHPHNVTAGDIPSLLRFASVYPKGEVTVYVSTAGVTAALGSDGRDRVHFPLKLSAAMTHLQGPAATGAYTQAQFKTLLKGTFDGCLTKCPSLPALIERVRFKQGQTVDQSLGQGRVSVSKQIEQDVTGTGTIPEFVTLNVPVWDGKLRQARADVRCGLDVDAGTCTFGLYALPGEVARALDEAEEQLLAYVRDCTGPDACVPDGLTVGDMLVVRGRP